MTNTKEKKTSIGLIVISLICFSPLGIYFIYRRITEEKTEMLRNSRTINAIGWIAVSLGVIYLILGLFGLLNTEGGETVALSIVLFMVIFFIGFGLLIIGVANKWKKRGLKYNKYVYIVNGNQTRIENIANAAAVSTDTALKDLQEMIDGGFFPGAYIDLNRREVILPGSGMRNQQVNYKPSVRDVKTNEPKRKVKKCTSCGGSNEVIEGMVTKCEYCDTPIAYED